MHFGQSDEQLAAQARARSFADDEVAPLAREADESGVYPARLVERVARLGFQAGPLVTKYDGSGMD